MNILQRWLCNNQYQDEMKGGEKLMKKWLNFEKDLVDWLSHFSNENLKFRNSYQAIVGFPQDGFRSDGMLTDGNVLLAIEVEAGQTHPDTNVGKYWLLHSQENKYRKIILFHVYTPKFKSYPWRKRLGEFYIDRMRGEVPIEYIQMDLRNAQKYDEVLSEVQTAIHEHILREFAQ